MSLQTPVLIGTPSTFVLKSTSHMLAAVRYPRTGDQSPYEGS